MELLQNRGDHSTEANQTTTTLNALLKDGGQSKKAAVSLAEPVIQIYGPVDRLHPLPCLVARRQGAEALAAMQLPAAEDVEYWHGEEKAGWLQSQVIYFCDFQRADKCVICLSRIHVLA